MLKILGYADRLSVAPGETVTFMVSSEDDSAYDARLVRVIHGDCNPAGPGLKFEPVAASIDGRYDGRRQSTDAGSYMAVEGFQGFERLIGFTFFAWVWPTLPKREPQTIAALWDPKLGAGFKIGLSDGGRLTLTCGEFDGATECHRLGVTMRRRAWYAIAVSVNFASRTVSLTQRPLTRHALTDETATLSAIGTIEPLCAGAPFTFAGCRQLDGTVGAHFDGKIDGPMLLRGPHGPEVHDALLRHPVEAELERAVIARWDFARGIPTTRAEDIGPHGYHGRLVNLPTRGMTGWNWTGESRDWTQVPEHYGAIHFHHDDLYDAAWEPSLSFTVPDSLSSGAYALEVRSGESHAEATREYYIPFFVRPPRRGRRGSRSRPPIAFLAPTCSYMAYANDSNHLMAREAERTMGRLLEFGHADLHLYDHPELGLSLYDSHADGSGVSISSRLRPVLNLSPRYHSWLGGAGSGLWQYNADTHLLDWLEQQGMDFDVITDEDLHQDGYAALAEYRVVLTGTHPEYHSTAMWDAQKAWIDRGGRLMYLGANGWYWRIAFHQELPGVIEVRRAEDGIRTWAAEPGEYHQAFNGEYGGLWRRNGRPPNVICGLGFIAQGFDLSSHYRRAPDAANPRAAFIFEGVEDEIIGDFGLVGGGAAGLELDCISRSLGSAPNILRLATSEDHTPLVLLVNEEFGVVPAALGGDQNDRVRADLAFYETPAGGAVFSVGSIAWCGSLSHNRYDNNVSRITGNVLRRFMDETPFETSE